MISNRIIHNLRLAIKLAKNNNNNMPWHLGAILIKGKELVSIGFNKMQTHTKALNPYKYLHAEASAIIGVPEWKLRDSMLFVARVGYDNRERIVMAKPCKHCSAMIIEANIYKVFFTVSDNMIGVWNVKQNSYLMYEHFWR